MLRPLINALWLRETSESSSGASQLARTSQELDDAVHYADWVEVG
jgi:hypothetical protein